MDLLLNQIVNGVTSGAEYALIAAGLALIFGVLEIVNFAHGELYMLSAYYTYLATSKYNLPYFIAVPVVIIAMAITGAIFYVTVIRRVIGRNWQVQLVSTLAVSVIAINTAIGLSGPTPKYIDSPIAASMVQIGSVTVSQQRLLVIAAAAVAFALLFGMLKYTKLGKAMRAVAQNRDAAQAVGISLDRIGLVAVVVGAALAGVAGALVPPLYTVYPLMAALVIIKAFAAVIMGGFGNVGGAIAAAFILAMIESMATIFVSSSYADAIVFAVMIVVLLVRPHGLFGFGVRV